MLLPNLRLHGNQQQGAELSLIIAIITASEINSTIINAQTIVWPRLYQLAVRHRVWHQVYQYCKNHSINNPTVTKLKELCAHDKLQQLATLGETLRITQAFNKRNILHCFIKGIVLNVELYQNLVSRPCRDIDVWVTPEELPHAIDALLALGYTQTLPNYTLTGFKQDYYFTHRHDIAFLHKERNVLVELHFRVDYFGVKFFPLTTNITTTTKILNTQVTTLKHEYHLLYLMLHASIHAYNRLRWLQDIHLYIKSQKCNLPQVFALAKALGLTHVVKQSLLLTQSIFSSVVPSDILLEHPTARSKHLASIAQKFIVSDYDVHGSYKVFHPMFYLYRYYLVLLSAKGQRLSAVLGDLFKIDILFADITLPKHCAFLYYVLYPIWIIKLIMCSVWFRKNI